MPAHALTFELSTSGDELNVHGDADGLRLLAGKLMRLAELIESGHKDHFHLLTEAWSGDQLSTQLRGEGATLLNKVTVHGWPY